MVIRPTVAFGHPLFCAALVALVINDHVLKQAHPGVITGKLSDFAGLIVAPAVLAWLMRVETKRGWLAAHSIVGIVFTALELSQPLADLLPVRMWADPTDLVALPSLAVSYVVFGREARASRSAPRARSKASARAITTRQRAERRAGWLVGVIALLACAATSPNRPAPRYPFRPGGRIETDAYVRHTDTSDLTLEVARLKDEVEVDCDGLLDVPERMVDANDFMESQRWTLTRGDALPLWDRFHDAPERQCYAVRLISNGITWLITWRHGTPAMREIEIRTEHADHPEEGAIVVRPGEEAPRVPPGVTVRRL